MANESVTHHTTSPRNGWFCKSTEKLNPNHRKQLKIKTKKLFDKIQNMNFNLSLQKKLFNCSCTCSSVCSNPPHPTPPPPSFPLIFHFLIKYFCLIPGDLDGRTNWYYFDKEIWKITEVFLLKTKSKCSCWKPFYLSKINKISIIKKWY